MIDAAREEEQTATGESFVPEWAVRAEKEKCSKADTSHFYEEKTILQSKGQVLVLITQ